MIRDPFFIGTIFIYSVYYWKQNTILPFMYSEGSLTLSSNPTQYLPIPHSYHYTLEILKSNVSYLSLLENFKEVIWDILYTKKYLLDTRMVLFWPGDG